MIMRIGSKNFEISCSQVLESHQGNCHFLHGHNYLIEIGVESCYVDEYGMVVDFGVLNKKIEGFLEKFDHKFLVPMLNKNWDVMVSEIVKITINRGRNGLLFVGSQNINDFAFLPIKNVTVEELTRYFLRELHKIDRKIIYLKIYETKDNYAEVEWSDESEIQPMVEGEGKKLWKPEDEKKECD